ncbi:MAG TPA: M23 family metallopeptidase [Afifellaceae bacterium]|nr:M23 family metallopeptidase [Afifellaceae bacterium]
MGLLALAAGLGGCSSMFRVDEPAFTGSTANQQSIITHQAGARSYAAAPANGVQVSDLPPPAGAPASAYMAAPAPAPYTPPRPQAAPAHAPSLATMGAPPTTLGHQAAAIGGASGTHVVQPGETAWSISQRHGISVEQLAAANGGSSTVRLGQTLRVPGGAGAQQPRVQMASVDPQSMPLPAAAPAAQAPVPVVVTPPPADPTSGAAVPEASFQQQAALTPATAAPAEAAAPANAAPSGFRWPVRGRVISGFGKKPNGERNDGINLAVPEGSPVKAAEDGEVIYAGNELKSYGNLVLIRHAGGWVSAYAHNSELKVNRGEKVKRGQVVSLSGMTGGVTTPQVHFELRKDATPVDPLQHMSES